FASLQEIGCQWVDEQAFTYRLNFVFAPDANLARRVLRFEGLDTVCRIFLNGALIAEHDNMFVACEIDVTTAIVVGHNELRVEFDSAWQVGRERRARYFEEQQLAPDTVRFEPRAFLRKAQYMFGWDWGPCLVSAGIWRPVSLIEYNARIRDVAVRQRHRDGGGVELEFDSEFEGIGEIYHWVDGIDRPVRDGELVRIDDPQLWWPSGLGEQPLYGITSVLVVGAPQSRQSLEAALDVREQRIGLRTVELVRAPDQFGESFQFVVNGRALYALGANWIPDDSFPSRVDAERVRRQLNCAKHLGTNMLRVWGGGLYESDEFYAGCDELGILVWQDFPFACSYYPDDKQACAAVRVEAEYAIRRLRNHPSLVIWCGNNENHMMRDSGWDGAEHHPVRYHGERIYDATLPDVLAELDASRPYLASSPIGKEQANSGTDGDQHFWDVWHGRGDWRNYAESDARFCSEFGFAAAPSAKAWHAMALSDLCRTDLRDRVARWHDKTAKGYETFVGFVELHYPVSVTLEDWTYYSQLNQRDALRFGIEHYRRSQFCRGALIWQFNDCWPVQSWSVVDSAFQRKAAAFELGRLYAPLLISLERVGDIVRVWAILDNAQRGIAAHCRVEVRSLDHGELLDGLDLQLDLEPGERRVVGSLDVSRCVKHNTVVIADVDGRHGFLLLAEPKELKLAASELTLTRTDCGLRIETTSPVVDLRLSDAFGECEFFDNYFTLGASGAIHLRSRGICREPLARSLAGAHPIRVIE
ncbi:MAG TPA: glycoside hydrolase family 2 TIM barrel-domain containing protein, partial [Polyangiaceae bacterium]